MTKKNNVPLVNDGFNHHGRSFGFDEAADIGRVVPFGAVDLALLAEEHAVPADVAASAGDFNDINEPDSILGRPRDAFDEIAMQRAVKTYKAPSSGDGNK